MGVDARTVFKDFKTLFPNNQEGYDPANLPRWIWHIRHSKNEERRKWLNAHGPETVEDARTLARSRSVATFEEMPEYTKTRYRALASIFIGRQIWACGSRVTGEYEDSGEGYEVIRMREILGKKKNKKASDYDFWMKGKPGENRGDVIKLLPSWADFVPSGIPGAEKIQIPMYEWDFSKLPQSEHQRVIEAYATNQVGVLMAIHNDHKLSPEHYCCDGKPVMRWFRWAIKEGIIKAEKT